MTGTIYQGYIKDDQGNIIEGASVEVRDQDTNTIVDLWSNRATTSTKSNPTTTDSNGYFFFYRTAGRYKITVTSDSYSAVFNNVPIGNAQERDTGINAGQIPLVDDLADIALSGEYDDLLNAPALGSAAFLVAGTGGGEVRTNSQNDSRFFRIDQNLNEGVASAMRANLALGTAALVNSDQNVGTTSNVTFAQLNVDNIRIDGNTISSTNTDGNITIDPAGTGTIELVGATNVTGAISATGELIQYGQGASAYQYVNRTNTSDIQTKYYQVDATGITTSRGTSTGSYAHVTDSGNYDLWLSSLSSGGTGGKIVLDADNVQANGAISATQGATLATSSGNVGVGSASPFGLLHLYQTGNTILSFANAETGNTSSDGTWLYIGAATKAFNIQNQESDSTIRHLIGSAEVTRTLAAGFEVTGAISATTQIKPGSYTVATLPTATGAGAIIYVSDEAGGATIAFSDNTNWRRVSDRAIVS
jgi:hypothetical protein